MVIQSKGELKRKEEAKKRKREIERSKPPFEPEFNDEQRSLLGWDSI